MSARLRVVEILALGLMYRPRRCVDTATIARTYLVVRCIRAYSSGVGGAVKHTRYKTSTVALDWVVMTSRPA